MRTFFFATAFALTGVIVEAVDLKPWYEEDFALYPRIDLLYQQYPLIDSSSGSKHRSSNDLFLTLGISGSYTPWEAWIESTCAHTRYRCFGFDNFRATGRYQLMSDTMGDLVSLTTGLILTISPTDAVKDISSFHHAVVEAEANVSIGKETVCQDDWMTRYWGVFGIGMGIRGYPWIRFDLAWEKRSCGNLLFRLFLNSLWGLGNHSLSVHCFDGYGSVRHRSIDIGARITKEACWGIFSFEYAHRVYACNFPARANLVLLRYCYPFGL